VSTTGPIIEFGVDRTNIRPGECVTFSWRVQNVKAVYFLEKGQRWQDHGVVGEGSRQVCPPQTTAYNLRVVKPDDSVEVRQIPITVSRPSEIIDFSVDRAIIDAGECVTFLWRVEGVKAVYFFQEGERWEDHGVVGEGSRQVCPSRTTTYHLRVVKRDDTVEIRQLPIQVRVPAPPPPPPPPAPALPVIEEFSVTPDRIAPGGCVDIAWRTGGGTSWVTIVRGEHVVLENAPLRGNVQDCPDAPGTVQYRLVAWNPADKRVREDRYVTVG
jgi:hypothetical protein